MTVRQTFLTRQLINYKFKYYYCIGKQTFNQVYYMIPLKRADRSRENQKTKCLDCSKFIASLDSSSVQWYRKKECRHLQKDLFSKAQFILAKVDQNAEKQRKMKFQFFQKRLTQEQNNLVKSSQQQIRSLKVEDKNCKCPICLQVIGCGEREDEKFEYLCENKHKIHEICRQQYEKSTKNLICPICRQKVKKQKNVQQRE